jgi:hypothetical protein
MAAVPHIIPPFKFGEPDCQIRTQGDFHIEEKMERPQALLPGVITFCPCAEGFKPTSYVSPSRRLPPSRLHHTTRVQIVAGPSELRVAHIFPQIIPFFTLFRRHRCTPNEY